MTTHYTYADRWILRQIRKAAIAPTTASYASPWLQNAAGAWLIARCLRQDTFRLV